MDVSRIKWQEFMSGNDDAYSWTYTTYVKGLYQYGLCFTSDTELVKDCIQDIFTYLYRNRVQLVLPEKIHRETLTEDLIEDIPFALELTVEEQFIQQEQYKDERRQVERILSLLTSRQREIIYYRFIQEMSMDEICTLMNLNYQSAQNLIQRSLKKIRSSVGDMRLLLLFLSFIR